MGGFFVISIDFWKYVFFTIWQIDVLYLREIYILFFNIYVLINTIPIILFFFAKNENKYRSHF